MTLSCVKAVNNLINGLKPAPKNESDGDITIPSPQRSSTSSIIQSLQQQVTLTLRKEGSIRIIEPNVACEGVVTEDPDMGIGIVILKDTDYVDDNVTTSTKTTTDDLLSSGSRTTNLANDTTVTQGQRSLVSSTPAPGTGEDVQFTNETVIVIKNLDEVAEETIGALFVPSDFMRQPSDNGKYHL